MVKILGQAINKIFIIPTSEDLRKETKYLMSTADFMHDIQTVIKPHFLTTAHIHIMIE
jgi:hypothetical protein